MNPRPPNRDAAPAAPTLSIILPVLNEAAGIADTLRALAPLRAAGHEVIVADGGSHDGTPARCEGLADAVIAAPRGRARQMNAGAAVARGAVLLFLHADTQLPAQADQLVLAAVGGGTAGQPLWGRFDVRIAGRSAWFPVIATLMNTRSRLSGIATGDQALFVRREVFAALGGFADQPLMEDIELSHRLRRVSAPACLRARVVTSGRRWEAHGVWRTIVLMWRLRLRYWLGASPEVLVRLYR
ncbi:MAG: TIGR04283 family arsenosugar biosynthesis glycosyltransferase [Leptothrix sp. (in: b-proteobacteria)]